MIHFGVETGAQQLERDPVDEPSVARAGEEDARHAAAADLAHEPVRADPSALDPPRRSGFARFFDERRRRRRPAATRGTIAPTCTGSAGSPLRREAHVVAARFVEHRRPTDGSLSSATSSTRSTLRQYSLSMPALHLLGPSGIGARKPARCNPCTGLYGRSIFSPLGTVFGTDLASSRAALSVSALM